MPLTKEERDLLLREERLRNLHRSDLDCSCGGRKVETVDHRGTHRRCSTCGDYELAAPICFENEDI